MDEFLKTWYGLALFIAFDVAAALVVMAIAYRWIFKRFWDAVAALVCMTILSPLYLAVLVRGKIYKKRTGNMRSLVTHEFYVGKKAKTIALRLFRTTDDDGNEAGSYGRWLRRTRFYKLPVFFDVFCGRLSFIGVRKFSFIDAAFVSEDDEGRFSVRPGLINPLVVSGDEETDYKEMLHSDIRYARRMSLFGDLKIFFSWLLKTIRGEKGYLGVTEDKTYAESLLEEGTISREDFDSVARSAAAEEEELRKTYEPVEEEQEDEENEESEGDTKEPSERDGEEVRTEQSENGGEEARQNTPSKQPQTVDGKADTAQSEEAFSDKTDSEKGK